MPRKKFTRSDNPSKIAQRFRERMLNKEDFRQLLAEAEYSDKQIAEITRDMNQSGLAELITKRGHELLVDDTRFAEWLEGRSILREG